MQYVTSFERLAKEEGVQQGMQQGQVKVLIDLLTHRFGPLPDEVHQRLEQATAEEIDTWAGRILDADSLEQVYGGDNELVVAIDGEAVVLLPKVELQQ